MMRQITVILCICIMSFGCGKSESSPDNYPGKAGAGAMGVSYFKNLSRKELINKGENILLEDRRTGYVKGLCSSIHIFANDSTVYMTFSVPIRFVRLNSGAYYGAMVDFVDDMVSYDSIVNPEDYKGEMVFYRETPEDRDAVSFVVNALKIDENFSKFTADMGQTGNSLTIIEQADRYSVTAAAGPVELGIEVYKETGEVNGFYNAPLIDPPVDGEPAVEIKKETE